MRHFTNILDPIVFHPMNSGLCFVHIRSSKSFILREILNPKHLPFLLLFILVPQHSCLLWNLVKVCDFILMKVCQNLLILIHKQCQTKKLCRRILQDSTADVLGVTPDDSCISSQPASAALQDFCSYFLILEKVAPLSSYCTRMVKTSSWQPYLATEQGTVRWMCCTYGLKFRSCLELE